MKRLLLLLCLVALLSACSKTVVVLVPDDDGKTGEVSVSNAQEKTLLQSADQSVGFTSKPDAPRQMSAKVQERLFGKALAAAPKAPVSFLFYFQPGSNTPDLGASANAKEIADVIAARSYPQVSVIGHTDTVGDDKVNNELALGRARVIRQLLVDNGVAAGIVQIYSFGKRDLLVPTADNVSEAKNRRVEIFIR